MKKKPPTNADSVGKLHFHKMGKYVVGRHETLPYLPENKPDQCFEYFKGSWANDLSLKANLDDVFIFFIGGHMQEKSCRGFLFLLLKVLI